jgi:hypothetical protein
MFSNLAGTTEAFRELQKDIKGINETCPTTMPMEYNENDWRQEDSIGE